MNKISVKISLIISVIFVIISSILGITYVLTGRTLDGKFIGHILNSDGTINDSAAPEIMAFAAGIAAIIGLTLSSVGLAIGFKGMTKPEKSENKKIFSTLILGVSISVIVGLFLMLLAPKQDWKTEQFKKVFWYYLLMAGLLFGSILSIYGLVNFFKSSKNPIIKNQIHKDEF